MKNQFKALILLSVCTGCLWLLGCSSSSDIDYQTGVPNAFVEQSIHSFGRVVRGEIVSAEFPIQNVGDAPLVLQRRTGKNAQLSRHIVEPGDTFVLPVQFDTSFSIGRVRVPIILGTNAPNSTQLRVFLDGEVESYVSAEPAGVRLKYVQGDKQNIIKQVIWSSDDTAFSVKRIDAPLPGITTKVRVARSDERIKKSSGQQLVLEIGAEQDAPVGKVAGFITLELEHPKQTSLKIPVTGFIRPEFAVTPTHADFGRIDLAERAGRGVLHVKNFGESDVSILRAEADIAEVSTEIKQVEKGRVFNVIVTLDQSRQRGPLDGTLTIHTTSRTKPVLKVPLSANVL